MEMSGRKCLYNLENNVDPVVASERDKITLYVSVCVSVGMKESERERLHCVRKRNDSMY